VKAEEPPAPEPVPEPEPVKEPETVREEKPATPAEPPTTTDESWCTIHQTRMTLRKNQRGAWYSHSLGGGRYCKGYCQ